MRRFYHVISTGFLGRSFQFYPVLKLFSSLVLWGTRLFFRVCPGEAVSVTLRDLPLTLASLICCKHPNSPFDSNIWPRSIVSFHHESTWLNKAETQFSPHKTRGHKLVYSATLQSQRMEGVGAACMPGLTITVWLSTKRSKQGPAGETRAGILALTRLCYLIGKTAGSSFLFYWHSIKYIEWPCLQWGNWFKRGLQGLTCI